MKEKLKVNMIKETFGKIKFSVMPLIVKPLNALYAISLRIILGIFYVFLVVFVILLYQIIDNYKENLERILTVVEYVTIGAGTLAILTFTFASVETNFEIRSKIIKSGKYLFQSTLIFIIGIVLLIGVRFMLEKPDNTSLIEWFILSIATISLVISTLFFVIGIQELIKVFKNE